MKSHILPRKTSQRPVSPFEWRILLKRARDHHRSAGESLLRQRWNQAGLSAIHAGTSLTEALLARVTGIMAASESGGELVYLLRRHISHPETSRYANDLMALVDQKTSLAFRQRSLTEEEARICFDKADGLLRWVGRQLPENHSE